MSGDWIPLSLPERARRFFPNLRLISLGGATEATIWSIFHPIERIDPAWVSIPYGRPIDNNAFYVLDRNLELVPPGVVGDLYIGGVGPIQSGTLRQHKNHAIGVNIPMISDPGPTISPQVSRKGLSESTSSMAMPTPSPDVDSFAP